MVYYLMNLIPEEVGDNLDGDNFGVDGRDDILGTDLLHSSKVRMVLWEIGEARIEI